MAKNDRDYAVVVGIKTYPAFDKDGPLEGPENDARAVYDWLISATGGNLPKEQVALIVSSDYAPPAAGPNDARPMINDVHRAFEDLQDKAEQNAKNKKGLQVGRRLYIYMAGHGFAPRDDQTALLMANATSDRTGAIYHVLGQYTANWFYKAKYFEEVILLMDCCRENQKDMGLNMSFKDINAPGAVNKVKRFYGYGTKWSRLSREKDIDGIRRGVFTAALIKGLAGGAVDPSSGELTARSLSDYLYTVMEKVDETEGPEIDFYPKNGKGFVLMKMPVPEFKVTLHVPTASVGKAAQIIDGGTLEEVKAIAAVTEPWVVELKRGKYLAMIPAEGLRRVIVVEGTGDVDESF